MPRSRLAAAAVTAGLVACHDSLKVEGSQVVRFIDIEAIAGATEPGDTVVVHFRARAPGAGVGVPGTELRLSVTSGGGRVLPESVFTDENGAASVHWMLGATEDSQALRIVAPNDRAATAALRTRWAVRAVEFDTTGIGIAQF